MTSRADLESATEASIAARPSADSGDVDFLLRGGGEMGALIRAHDWAATPLGPIRSWPQSLRTVVGTILLSPVPIVLLWGEDGVMIYNDAYSAFAGGRHPRLLGSKVREGWPEVADFNDNVMKIGLAGGTLSYKDQELTLHRHGRPEQVWMNLDYSPVPDESGKPAGVIAIVVETTGRVLGERRLREGEERFRALVNASSDVVYRMSPDWTEMRQLDGRGFIADTESPSIRWIDEYIFPEDQPHIRAAIDEAVSTKGVFQLEHRVRRVDGSVGWTFSRAIPVTDADGEVTEWFGMASDVTERKRAEQALRESEERLRIVQAAGGIGSFDYDFQKDEAICSPEYYDILGLPPGHPINRRSWEAAIHPDDRAKALEALDRSAAERKPFDYEYRIVRADNGEVRWLSGRAAVIFDAAGNPWRYVGGNIDVTERVLVEGALRESENRFRTVFENAGVGMLEIDADWRILGANPAYSRITGFSLEELVGRSSLAFTHPEDIKAGEDALRRIAGPGAERTRFEKRYIRKDGSIVWVRSNLSRISGEGEQARFLKVVEDITAVREIEDALHESEERLRAATEAADIGTWDFDPLTGALRWDARCKQLFGLPPWAQVDYDTFLSGLHPDDRARTDEAVQHALSPGGPGEYDVQYRTIGLEDGVERWISAAGRSVFEGEGEGRRAVRFIGTVIDITEPMRTGQALRETSTRLNAILNNTEMAVFMMDNRQQCVFMNKAAEELTGYSFEETQGRRLHDVIHHKYPDGRPYPVEECPIDRALPTDDQVRGEEIFVHKDGHFYPVAFTASPLRNEAGEPIGTIIEARNIAEEKARDAALREAEERYRFAARATNDAIWDWDLVRNHVLWNEALYAVYGYRPEEVKPTGEWWIEHIHPDDRQRVVDGIHAVIEGGGERWQDAYRVRAADGSYRSVFDRGSVIRDRDGRAVRMIGAMLDQTEIRAAEEALREESRTLETLNRTGAAVAGELDLERVVQMVTDAGVELTGAQFGAFFYNVLDAAGESYLLYTLSGVDRSAFDKFPMPRNTAVFAPTFNGEGVVRSDNITQDPRYGKNKPRRGMPEGHLPVVSYLAVPVVSRSGEVLGGLFFGHPEPGRFNDRHERLMVGIAAQAAIAIDNARLYQAAQRELQERMRAERELRELNETLESRVAEEIAQRAEAEEQLRQSQKMETVGQLTGGLAHDFNNLLQVVTGNLEILLRNLPADAPRLRRSAENAMKGAGRAATLTQRLLAFSRRQPLSPRPVEINKLVGGMSELLHRTLGELIEVETVLAPRLWRVEVDSNQLENAILNLALNARDAMPAGGKLTIETQNTHLDLGYVAQNAEVTPGQYVVICVSDSGSGMDENTVARAFEPFFTTKEVGKGTGLGLSMVYGFVKQSGGHLKIYSEPGEGTTVKIYLPRLIGGETEEEEAGEQIVPEGTRDETILVCEDDDDVRTYSVEVLRELGYRVLEAHDGPSALRLLERQEGRVDLLFTDVVLPGGMTGAVLAEEARKLRPRLKVLFTTGYARNAIVHHGRLDPGVELITKPFSYSDLAARVRDLLDRAG